MTAEQFRVIESVFHKALERPAGPEREDFLNRQCPSELREQVRELLAADDIPRPPAREPAALPKFGPYQAETVLGSGGSGLVYRARRVDGQFEQEVAVKVLRASARTEYYRLHFLAERQILAQLKHPNIATLLDGGVTGDGEPFLVMEYVAGEPLDVFCDQRRLSNPGRLRLFRQVMDAVEHAHRNLVVHRDLKPSNILVTKEGTAKLLDFGTSKLIQDDPTATATQALTPRYASPEQLRGEQVTTASDVFSLGMILYELLTGSSAYGTRHSMLSALERAMEQSDPAVPSTVVTDAAASARSVSTVELKRALRGDIASVLLKALASEPARRYRSVREFSEDVERYLDGLPVSARPRTVSYRAGKFLRRHWLASAAASIAVIAIVAGLVATFQAKQVAERRFQDVRSIANYMLTELDDELAQLPASTPVRASMSERSMKYLDSLRRQAGSDVGLRLELAQGYLRLGDVLGNLFRSNIGRPQAAQLAYQNGMQVAEQLTRERPQDPAPRRLLARLEMNRALAESFGSSGAASLDKAKQAIETLERLAGESASDHYDLGRAYLYSAVIGQQRGGMVITALSPGTDELARAETHLKRAVELAPAEIEYRMTLADLYARLGILHGTSDPTAALRELDQAIATFHTMPASAQNAMSKRYWLARIFTNQAWALGQLQRYDEALSLMQRAQPVMELAGEMDPDNVRLQYDLTGLHRNWGIIANYAERKREAIGHFETGVRIYDSLPQLTDTLKYLRAELLMRIASLHTELGESEAAGTRARQALEALRPLADQPAASANCLSSVAKLFTGDVAKNLRDPQAAVRYAERAVAKEPDEVRNNEMLAACYYAAGRRADAIKALERALAMTPAPKPGEPEGRSRAGILDSLAKYRNGGSR